MGVFIHCTKGVLNPFKGAFARAVLSLRLLRVSVKQCPSEQRGGRVMVCRLSSGDSEVEKEAGDQGSGSVSRGAKTSLEMI